MNLSDLFEETMTGTLPPSRWSAEDAYRAGRRRRRVSVGVRVGLVVLPVLAMVVALVAVVAPQRDADVADPPPSRWVVHAVGGFNQQRLWAYIEPCGGCGYEFRTSDDGGRTWAKYVADRAELDQLILTTAAGGVALARDPASIRVAWNGWGVLQAVAYSPEPLVEPPLDSPVHCVSGTYVTADRTQVTDPGTVRIVDVLGARYGPTQAQPAFNCRTAVRVPDGVILAAGRDAGTGRPTVARSLDNGSTWETTVLPDQPVDAGAPLTVGHLLGSVGGGAVVAFEQGSWTGLYRYDSGAWSRLSPGGPTPDQLILTRDNTLVAQTVSAGGGPAPGTQSSAPATASAAFTVNRPGETGFQPISRPAGIGREVILGSGVLPNGGHLAFNTSRVWTSADGRSWTAVPLG